MKKIIFFLLITACICSSSLFAQTQDNTNKKAQMQQMMKQYLKDSIQLSDVMIDSVMAVRSEFQPQTHSINADQSLTPDEKKAKMDELKKQIDIRYKDVGLTEDQIVKIEDHDKRIREQMHNKMNGGNGK